MTNRSPVYRLTPKALHIDWPLFGLMLALITAGLAILYSASNENLAIVYKQGLRFSLACSLMIILAFIPPHKYKLWSPWFFAFALCLLVAVTIMGKIGKGAQRWLDLGIIRFQPSELMKLAVPLMTAWYLDKKSVPLSLREVTVVCIIIFIPGLLVVKQPDLGTGLMIIMAGLAVFFIAGLSMRIITTVAIGIGLLAPIFWQYLHDYQKQRILTFVNPEHDPLGAGYHIIQSKIAIGSGGAFGKGWLNGSQSHLNFLPEHATDFIFAVSGEELGFIGSTILIILLTLIALRGMYIASLAQTAFSRLVAAGLALIFFLSAFVNIGMVMGILPVVGIPLPLISYGGTQMLTFMASFGILMSISTHRILFDQMS